MRTRSCSSCGKISKYGNGLSPVPMSPSEMCAARSPWNQAFAKRFWQGLPYGFAMLSLLIGIIAALHCFSIDGIATSGATAVKFGLLYGLGFSG